MGDTGSATVLDRFLASCTRPTEASALTADEYRELLRQHAPGQGHFEFRRLILGSARARLAVDPAGLSDPGLAREYNGWREDIAAHYLDDTDLAPASRSRAALKALLEDRTSFDDIERVRTLALAGRACAMMSQAGGALTDTLAAATYYTDAWRACSTIGEWTYAIRAAELWLQCADSEERRLRSYQPDELILQSTQRSEEWRRHASAVFESVHERSHQALGSLATSLATAAGVDAGPEPWPVAQAAVVALATNAHRDADRTVVKEAWHAALAAAYATVALGRWDEARLWSARLLDGAAVFGLASGDSRPLDNGFSETVASMLRLQALQTSKDMPTQAVGLLVPLLGHDLRDDLRRFLLDAKAQSRTSGEQPTIDEELTQLEAVLHESETAPLSDATTLGRLVTRVAHDHRRGRLGLALSGGGFRASLYHLGVLARLADLDLLRSVEVISGVSGGTIVGACYYLKVKELLESRHDSALGKDDFVRLVADLCDQFLEGTQTNIRARIFADGRGLFRLWLRPRYSRTNRVAELIESELFARVTTKNTRPLVGDLLIRPFGETKAFDPEQGNWRRASKVPTFVANATTLNTGHNWQFTARTAGEPVSAIDALDPTPRLRAFGYWRQPTDDGPPAARSIRFSDAVAASACVPGIFPPMEFLDFYRGIPVRLVDGGVFDNQGVSALLDRGCDVVVASDGSRQIDFQRTPSPFAWSTATRTNDVLMERVRQLQFRALAARRDAGVLRGLAVTHLTGGLSVTAVDPKGDFGFDSEWREQRAMARALEYLESLATGQPKRFPTEYGIAEDLQRTLGQIRTDLDCFHQLEAYTLFVDGYKMATVELQKSAALHAREDQGQMHTWRMAKIRDWIEGNGPLSERARTVLDVSRARFFKLARLTWLPRLGSKAAAAVIAAIVTSGALLAWIAWPVIVSHAPTVRSVFGACALIGLAAGLDAIARAVSVKMEPRAHGLAGRYRVAFSWRSAAERFVQLVSGCVLPLAYVWSRLHLAFVDKRYLRLGAVDTTDGRVGGPPLTK